MAPSLLSLSVLAATVAGALAAPRAVTIGNNANWTPRFASTSWTSSGRGPTDNGVNLYYTGQIGCSGIQQLSAFDFPDLKWRATYCLSNDNRFGDRGNWNINTNAAFAPTAIGKGDDLGDLRLFYWSWRRGRDAPKAVIRDAYWSSSGRGSFKPGKLELVVEDPNFASLAATTWLWQGTIGRTVFYVQDGWLKEITLVDGGEWSNQGREGIQLHYRAGEISAVSWVDDGVLYKVVYVQDLDTNQVVEYAWSSSTPFTSDNNLYATPAVQNNAAHSAASLIVSNGRPQINLWYVGPTGGNVHERPVVTHGHNAKTGSHLSATAQSPKSRNDRGTSFVFFINRDGKLTESYRTNNGQWKEDIVVSFYL
ncbi:hypothetical protein FRB99_008188 [Tulasnella sp. 403]|nr:hypothetical protein FRB99_008188 [Tulasnella sp. 403]